MKLPRLAKPDWVWMPHPGHFICSRDCKFFLNTYVGGYIVSTVGEYWPDRAVREIHAEITDPNWHRDNRHLKGDRYNAAYMERFGYQEIGCGRTYETMVFKAKPSSHSCCPFEQVSGQEEDSEAYNDPTDARNGHLAMCEKWGKPV